MFIGHFAVGMAAKRVTPQVSLAVLVVAAQLADLLWPVLLALGIEQVVITDNRNPFLILAFVRYPYSHSLVWLALWALAFGAICGAAARRLKVAGVVAALVSSHWVLDAVTHRPDVPLLPSGPMIGLGMWNSIRLTALVEGTMYAAGVWIYLRCTQPTRAAGTWGFLGFVVFLAAAYVASLLGPPPPSAFAIAISAMIGGAVLVIWCWWADRHRRPRTSC